MTPVLADWGLRVPDAGIGLPAVLPAWAAAQGLPAPTSRLGLRCRDRTVFLLIDGLGWEQLVAHSSLAPALCGLAPARADGVAWIDAAFPSTTAVGLTSFGTGLCSTGHGLVGGEFLLPDTGRVLRVLHWSGTPSPLSVQPEPTWFERLESYAVDTCVVGDPQYRASGLTGAAWRGARYVGATGPQRIAAAATAVGRGPALTLCYYGELDRAGHAFGVDSPQWRQALADADRFTAALIGALPPGADLVVTADHGMVDCPDADAVDLEARPRLWRGCRSVAGEPRMWHFYLADRHPAAVHRAQADWQDHLGGRAVVLRRAQAWASGLFGEGPAAEPERMGDLVALAAGRTKMLCDSIASRSGQLIGQHGSATEAELRVPLLVHR